MEGRFNGGSFALPLRGAYTWSGLFSEFYGITRHLYFKVFLEHFTTNKILKLELRTHGLLLIVIKELILLYRHECHSRKLCTKLHPGLEWSITHTLSYEDIDDVISRYFTVACFKVFLKQLTTIFPTEAVW